MFFSQIDFPIFVLALIANLALLTVVLQFGPKDRSRIFFSLFVLFQMFWITVNYFAFRVSEINFLLVSRLTMFFAVFHSLFFFLFVKHFLSKTDIKKLALALSACGVLVSILTLTPYIFSRLTVNVDGTIAPQPGSLIPLFGIFVAFCIGGGFYTMIKRYRQAIDEEKLQWKFLMFGFILTFLLVLLFSFLNFILFGNLNTVRFGHLYTLPFVIFTSYAMIKHKLLNIKAVVAEIMVIALNSIIFIQLINSESTSQFIISGLVLVGTLIVGVQLIRGIEKEVKQRELLEALTQELADANDKLQALDKARAEFITIASHQLRTPPATIKWYLSSLISGDYGKIEGEQKEIIEKTNRTNNSLISLIDDMLNVSRIERGKMEFLFQPADLLELAKITVEQLEPIAKDKGLKLVFTEPKKNLPELVCDKEKVRQVMNNLIDNSIKYTKQGSVTVQLSAINNEIRFSVTDTGKGMSPEEKSEIFEKYKRGKESLKQSAGLGLGLYVAKVIIEQHKGKIWAESQGEGKGSSFIFTLPINSGLSETSIVDLTKTQN